MIVERKSLVVMMQLALGNNDGKSVKSNVSGRSGRDKGDEDSSSCKS